MFMVSRDGCISSPLRGDRKRKGLCVSENRARGPLCEHELTHRVIASHAYTLHEIELRLCCNSRAPMTTRARRRFRRTITRVLSLGFIGSSKGVDWLELTTLSFPTGCGGC